MVPVRISIVLVLVAFLSATAQGSTPDNPNHIKSSPKKEERAAAKLPPCAACAALVGSFEKGMERTARGKFEGGDAAWEEKNQGKGYASSEVRFVEIQERICKDLERGETQCHDNHHSWEDHLETWWKIQPMETRAPLKDWLCIETLKACCPEEHFGADCEPCFMKDKDGVICSGNGKCKGSGTRKGNGKCACDRGYGGELCEKCAVGFYESYKDEDKALCSPCHKSCLGHCTGSGPKNCAACKGGYTMDKEHGCTDIDECLLSQPCTGNKFCVNTEGTFQCLRCDKACNGCEGDGPDSCLVCAEGFVKNKDGLCITEQTAGRIFTISNTRFFTYIGLGVAACIIFQRSVVVAGILGLVIAVYITISEYYLQNASGELKPIL
ncbi:hypothetical protein TCAL_05218 [Tigriopus californicus]|uniref:EGF-like domain-containing protein n=1 Tax=Tigriopus californicus TaxID=6832 RepID=A0A553NS15_TIGCA|nr:cysteine-rich with EGF-like domain protein 2 isoform X1 [Tigriopus californicus]TRY68225.1 hypothetical protein TCAL_05218 [Tigriopus californicus]|eukprot:TCALIF_05218-PA protein Name:"Similar to creld2 Cysteine-rich with EGF-like domain protein 2 (Danio rerio)" AED:0.01 eAED:0.01 QI:0/-1/0/1/-1/1/1/0/381